MTDTTQGARPMELDLARMAVLAAVRARPLHFRELLETLRAAPYFGRDLPLAPLLHSLEDDLLLRGTREHPRRYALTRQGRAELARLRVAIDSVWEPTTAAIRDGPMQQAQEPVPPRRLDSPALAEGRTGPGSARGPPGAISGRGWPEASPAQAHFRISDEAARRQLLARLPAQNT